MFDECVVTHVQVFGVVEDQTFAVLLFARASQTYPQAALGDDYPRSVGHGNGYFSDFSHACAEPWAEIMDAQLANPKAYELIEQYFPQSVTIFNTMVKEVLV